MTSPPATSVLLLAQADGLLNRGDDVRRQSVRIACFITRAALEERVDELLAAKSWDVGSATMAGRLSCLESALAGDGRDVASRAEYAWAALSRACHQHAYELTPTPAEARHLGTLVAGLVAA